MITRRLSALVFVGSMVAIQGPGAVSRAMEPAPGHGAASSAAPRAPAPQPADIRIVTLSELDAAIRQHRGQGVLLNFWAIWCEPCVAELPDLMAVAREFRDRGGVVLGVSYDLMIPAVTRDAVMEQMRAFVAERQIDIPILIFDGPDYDAINSRFGLPGPVPVTVAIDRAGTIVARHAGKSGRDGFVDLMEKALAH
jgi:thiol-disulfide isomerase/thioredoxin